MTKNLTAKFVERHKVPGRYTDGTVKGLKLQITVGDSGTVSKSYLLRYERDGHERMMGLGSTSDVTLKQARERGRMIGSQIAAGLDPLDLKEANRQARLADQAADALLPALTLYERVAVKYADFVKRDVTPGAYLYRH